MVLCSPAISHFGVTVLSAVFTGGSPQANTNTVKNTQGIHAHQYEGGRGKAEGGPEVPSSALSPPPSTVSSDFAPRSAFRLPPSKGSSGKRQVSRGRQKRSKTARATSAAMPATTSTSHGPW